MTKNTVSSSKIRASIVISHQSSLALYRGRALGVALGVERLGGGRDRGFTDGLERLGVGLTRLARIDVLGELLRRYRADLEVHHRVEGAAHLGAAADERAFLLDLGDLEDVIRVIFLRIRHHVAL